VPAAHEPFEDLVAHQRKRHDPMGGPAEREHARGCAAGGEQFVERAIQARWVVERPADAVGVNMSHPSSWLYPQQQH
jgi:hypothetical protein